MCRNHWNVGAKDVIRYDIILSKIFMSVEILFSIPSKTKHAGHHLNKLYIILYCDLIDFDPDNENSLTHGIPFKTNFLMLVKCVGCKWY